MYSFAIEGLRPPAPYTSTVAKMQYNRVRKLASGLFAVDHLGFTAVETTEPVVTGASLPADFEIISFGETQLQQIFKTEQTDVESLEALVGSATEAWRKLLEKSQVRVVRMDVTEVRTPIERPDGLVVVSNLDEAATFMDGKGGPSEFSHFIASEDEYAAIRRITEGIPLHSNRPDLPGHGTHI